MGSLPLMALGALRPNLVQGGLMVGGSQVGGIGRVLALVFCTSHGQASLRYNRCLLKAPLKRSGLHLGQHWLGRIQAEVRTPHGPPLAEG